MRRCHSGLPQVVRPHGLRGEVDLSTPSFRIGRIEGQRGKDDAGQVEGPPELRCSASLQATFREGDTLAPTRTSKLPCFLPWMIGPRYLSGEDKD
jgi:hypothetical protein